MGTRSQADKRRATGRSQLRPGLASRRLALEVVLAWDASRETADALFAGHPGVSRLTERDRDLAAELVRGVFRWRGRLDWILAHWVRRPLEELERPLLWNLRLGLFQAEHLDRVPAHAVVDTSVELAKRFGSRGGAALVNAVLRRATSGTAPPVEPDAAEDPLGHLVARTGHPEWLLVRWLDRYGFRRTLELAAENNRKPSLTLRVASDRVSAADLLDGLVRQGVRAQPGELLPDAVRLPDGWSPVVRDLLESGVAVVQDEAAGLVSHLARPAPGLRVLDVCAAPGGKTVHFARLCGDANVIAADVSAARLRRLRSTLTRTGVQAVRLIAADGRHPATSGGFDRVLVDAPCSNTGVLARRPDARWRRSGDDVARLSALQGEILDAARDQVGPGGILVYSTCSLEPEENEGVIARYRERHPRDAILPAEETVPREVTRDGFLATYPPTHHVDGAFGAAIRPERDASGREDR